MLWSSPILGVGFRKFGEHHTATAHNSFFLVASETGLVGLYLWLGLLYFTFRMVSWIKKQKNIRRDYLIDAPSDGLTAFLITAYFLSRAYILLPYLLIALSVASVHLRTQEAVGSPISPYGISGADLRNIGFLLLACLAVWKVNLVVG